MMATATGTIRSAYLAGPDVFLKNAVEVLEEKQRLCSAAGIHGLAPADKESMAKVGQMIDSGQWDVADVGLWIAVRNMNIMQNAGAIIANLTPFHGPSADVGTVFEVGYMTALGKPVFAYSNDSTPFPERAEAEYGPAVMEDSLKWDQNGYMIEDFGLHENLMIEWAVRRSSIHIFTPHDATRRSLDDLQVFEECLAVLADSEIAPS